MLEFCKLVLGSEPISEWELVVGGGGNWDDRLIEKFAKRLGLSLLVTQKAKDAVKVIVSDERGALMHVKHLRNKLAHGAISFTECGTNVAPDELRDLTQNVTLYLSEVVDLFATFVQTKQFLKSSTSSITGGVT